MALEISRLGSPHSPPPMLGRLLGGCIFCRPLSRGSGNRHADNLWPPARPVELLGVLRAPGCATRRRGRVGARPGGPPRPWRDLSRPRLSPHHVVLFHGRPPALTSLNNGFRRLPQARSGRPGAALPAKRAWWGGRDWGSARPANRRKVRKWMAGCFSLQGRSKRKAPHRHIQPSTCPASRISASPISRKQRNRRNRRITNDPTEACGKSPNSISIPFSSAHARLLAVT